jgi:membrane protease YdiL (CAAX protease family)
VIIQLAAYSLNPDFLESTLFLNLLSPVSIYLFGLPALLIVIGPLKAKAPEKKKMKLSVWLMILIICFGVMYIGAYVSELFMSGIEVVSQFFESEVPDNNLDSLVDLDNLWITAIGVVVIAPIGEELVFRKLLIDRLSRFGAFVSIFLSALIFGLMHGNFYQFFYAFGVGLVFGYVYYTTANVFLTIGMHMVVNFLGSIVSVLLTSGLQDMLTALEGASDEDVFAVLESNIWTVFGTLAFFFFILAAVVCAIVLPIVFRKRIVLEKGEDRLPRGKGFSTVVGNAGMIAMLAIYGVEFVLSLIS